MKTVHKMKILWLSGISCNGNAHSFLNYRELEEFLKDFEFIYHPIIPSKYNLIEVAKGDLGCDILLIEGAISPEFKKGDTPIINLITKYAPKVKKIVTVGTCATFGGIFRDSSYSFTTGVHFNSTYKEVYVFLYTESLNDIYTYSPIIRAVLYASPIILANYTLYYVPRGLRLNH